VKLPCCSQPRSAVQPFAPRGSADCRPTRHSRSVSSNLRRSGLRISLYSGRPFRIHRLVSDCAPRAAGSGKSLLAGDPHVKQFTLHLAVATREESADGPVPLFERT
jgi:hypothetical protein